MGKPKRAEIWPDCDCLPGSCLVENTLIVSTRVGSRARRRSGDSSEEPQMERESLSSRQARTTRRHGCGLWGQLESRRGFFSLVNFRVLHQRQRCTHFRRSCISLATLSSGERQSTTPRNAADIANVPGSLSSLEGPAAARRRSQTLGDSQGVFCLERHPICLFDLNAGPDTDIASQQCNITETGR